MASQALQILLLLLIFLPSCILSFISGKTATATSKSPQSFSCGHGISIGYPFWLQSQESNVFHGYPGFNISCQGDNPILLLANQLYAIKNFNESEKTLTISYIFGEENNPSCPMAGHDVRLDIMSPLLNFTRDNNMLHFFYNCTLYPPSLPDIKCLQHGAKHSYVFVDPSIPEFDWQRYCESKKMVPVIGMTVGNGGSLLDLVNGSGRALRQGFKLTWKPDLVCEFCEATGGFCGHRTNVISRNFVCFCSDGHEHPSTCPHSGLPGSLTSKPNFKAAGALIFGGIIVVISTVMYNIWKKKFGRNKQGFRHIPTNGM